MKHSRATIGVIKFCSYDIFSVKNCRHIINRFRSTFWGTHIGWFSFWWKGSIHIIPDWLLILLYHSCTDQISCSGKHRSKLLQPTSCHAPNMNPSALCWAISLCGNYRLHRRTSLRKASGPNGSLLPNLQQHPLVIPDRSFRGWLLLCQLFRTLWLVL